MCIRDSPSTGFIQLKLREKNIQDYRIIIYDAQGKNVYELDSASENITLSLPDGYYTVSLINNRSSYKEFTKKLIINR